MIYPCLALDCIGPVSCSGYSREMNVFWFGCCHCRYLLVYRCVEATLLCCASPYSNITSIDLSSEYSALCAIFWYVTLLKRTPLHQNINSSDLLWFCILNDYFFLFVVLPHSCHMQCFSYLTNGVVVVVYLYEHFCLLQFRTQCLY
jgi:hypothetical protein